MDINKLSIKLIGDKNITLKYGDKYKETGAKASFRNDNLNDKIKIIGTVNNKKIGTYKITYKINKSHLNKKIIRTIKVIDDVSPIITLKDGDISLTVGDTYDEPGYTASDNYDGDLTNKVEVNSNIDNTKVGTYEIIYKVSDSSNNPYEIKRIVTFKQKVKALPSMGSLASKIAVLNYHFFYDPSKDKSGASKATRNTNKYKIPRYHMYKTTTLEEFINMIS